MAKDHEPVVAKNHELFADLSFDRQIEHLRGIANFGSFMVAAVEVRYRHPLEHLLGDYEVVMPLPADVDEETGYEVAKSVCLGSNQQEITIRDEYIVRPPDTPEPHRQRNVQVKHIPNESDEVVWELETQEPGGSLVIDGSFVPTDSEVAAVREHIIEALIGAEKRSEIVREKIAREVITITAGNRFL